ncbi:hypothetical protein C2E23DRAFT_887439 [Lenzites betulinus]|nr:hypothetical protein C2E23DRAFT_887439 [Lenzites betulinus]
MAITVSPYAFFDVTLGVTLIGLAVTASLFGVATGQVVWYYKHYPHDRRFLKMLVALVWSFDAFHLMLYGATSAHSRVLYPLARISHEDITVWNYLVLKEVQALGLTLLPWESSAQLLCNAFAVVTIQSFYTYRIWTLSQKPYLAALLVVFVFGDFGLAFTIFMKSLMTMDVTDYIGLANFDIALSSVTASTDILLCGTLVILLAMSRTGSAGANRLINKLVLYTINTGALTTFCAVVSLITVVIMPTTSVYVMFYYIGTRLYSVSLLATLNARESLRIQAERIGHVTFPRLTSISRASGPAQPVVVAIQHNSSVALAFEDEDDDESGVKEVYRRPRGGRREPPSEPEEGSSMEDSCHQWKLNSRPMVPMYQ